MPVAIRDAPLGISRTEPKWAGRVEVRENEALHLEAIRRARRLIYFENQYFTSPVIAAALAERLAEPVLICPAFVATARSAMKLSSDSPERWLMIDPKPYIGDPHYDVLQHMLNDGERLVADPGAFADRMADLAGLDRRRTRRWLLARCVQEAGEFDDAASAALRLASDGVE